MATLRELKGRIGSVASSEKITGAMKMISSAKMHKADGIIRRLVPYRDCIRTIISGLLSSDANVASPLIESRQEVKRIGIVVLGSDEGLCGAYNVNIFKGMLASLAQMREKYGNDVEFRITPIGKKMHRAVAKICEADPYLSFAPVDGLDSKSDGAIVRDFAASLISDFQDGNLDVVHLCYMHYFSAGRQRLANVDYLPISSETLAEDSKGAATGKPYIFEPAADDIFNTVLPMYLLSRLSEAFAQNRASEQAARVMAMQSANDNAKKLLEQLQLEYNKLRQQSITTELLDIVGGQVRD